jgi:hypothetical protein
MSATAKQKRLASNEDYGAFDQLDGRHPWRDKVPEGLILYPVRTLSGGKVSYFNFDLAKEMGLIPKNHPKKLTKSLTEKLLETFCIRIINEYDQKRGTKFPKNTIKPNPYMATRYLQLQHSDKSGRTSGDGRCIWNGVVAGGGKVWDVSSRGTGVTALAPGAVQAGQPLKSGNTQHGYGCGMAEIDELFGAAIMAEIFHRNNVPTERVLCIVDLGKGVGIGVRAAPNLIRPAHMFLFLKQGKLEPLKRATDYLIDRQAANRAWNIKSDDKERYTKLTQAVTRSFARFAARLDRDYIFAWLDWDGDNVLADAGIIDYGSVRQFGLRHDQYRYDDVERMSTNLNEQRYKARELVRTFAQMTDFLASGVKKPFGTFDNSPWLKEFDREFTSGCLEHFLFQAGFSEPHRRLLMNKHRREVERLFEVHCEFERVKTYKKIHKVADGVHREAIFNMRKALAKMPEYLCGLPAELIPLVESREFFSWILSSAASRKDRRLTLSRRQQMARWQQCYIQVLRKITSPQTWDKTLVSVKARATQINNEARLTGNGLIHIVDEILRYRRKGLSDAEIQMAIENLIDRQTLNPDFKAPAPFELKSAQQFQNIMRNFLSVVHGYREDI